MAMGSADLEMTLGPSPGYHVTLGKCLLPHLWASGVLSLPSQLLFLPCYLHYTQQEPAAGKAAIPTLWPPDSSLSYPGRLASTWLPLHQSKPGQTSSKRPLSFLASEVLPPDPAKESAATARPGNPVSLPRAQPDTL